MNVLERIKKQELTVLVGENYEMGSSMKNSLEHSKELIKLAEIGQRMQWISVDNQLPEHEQEVIVYVKTENGYLVTGGLTWYSDVEKFIDGLTVLRLNKSEVSHWMELPNKPI